ncbi:putative ABC-type multidrug transport system,permease component [Vibrio nigripulchritudo SFn27]|uniref:Putative ABC-type multidrug transport system, permease component n=1 Tax=Vibrio nigripulchritudo TaxID=28173 RepID=U4K5S6_9VIBR|nr:ABC transporter permease [Vibrio nigripulchritudo]CCN81418.1 putative ABC-type multidrug transport system,permease component [Vibrio nigripulchritudo BLFn1]CCN88910.1 putative ABC-type multidrug transport system,permease component [Vibrio nigripulchritudo SFn27]CCN96712.1 putative ABC-type multidrug transport system,permease component [Vibrio nigripulchritudo ENn2]CCO39122.1 putative ABC-type multidrug transport system,permease component [Vibrio nigripulchritudo SFn135]CCO54629.1 putative A
MNVFQLIRDELKAIFSHPAIVLTVFGGTLFYSFLYPLPYANQVAQEQQITVVNLDKSQTSYQLERMVDATPQVSIVSRTHTVEDAKAQFLAHEVSGILVIPEHFYRDMMLGKSPVLSYAGDASYFLVFGTVVEGLAQASGTLAAKAKVAKLVSDGLPLSQAAELYSPVHLNLKPTFNPEMGYVDYVVPAVFVLILHQTLIMGTGILTASQRNRKGYWEKYSATELTLTRIVIFGLLYVALSLYYFGFSFNFYEINRLAGIGDLFILLVPFLIGAGAIGIVLGGILPRVELVTLLVLVSSMPLIFTAGFIWPLESIPAPLVWLANVLPSAPAIQGFLKINQMGAEIWQIKDVVAQLWILAAIWSFLAWLKLKMQPLPIKQSPSIN